MAFPFKVIGGNTENFDPSEAACLPFGFFHGYRVSTPRGNATVIGVKEGKLWFHVDGEQGATALDGDYEALLGLGVTQIEDAPTGVYMAEKAGDYHVKRIDIGERRTHIILQNENGPCPLIAICNCLLVRGEITLQPREGVSQIVTADQMCEALMNKMLQQASLKGAGGAGAEVEEAVMRVSAIADQLPKLQGGLDVNFSFTSIDDFEPGGQIDVFGLSGVRLVHGWIVDPSAGAELARALAGQRYNDVVSRLVTESDQPLTHAIHAFLQDTGNQLTNAGLGALRHAIAEDEVVVLFRNNHFSTITKHAGELYSLVTDVGYERERNIVWELLVDLRGARSEFFASDFVGTQSSKIQEASDTLVLMGYDAAEASMAVREVTQVSGRLVDDDTVTLAIAWIAANRPVNGPSNS
ncbi:DUF544 family protein [Pelomyxa schiedti]|nr:DUF544 family protein [Pelomyxa schiedti]